MRNQLSGAEILATARQTLLKELLPLLPPERKYDILMIANAMAIAARELETGDQDLRREYELLTKLYKDCEVSEIDDLHKIEACIHALKKRLAADIRAGVFDDNKDMGETLHALLLELVMAKLRQSNPKHLKAFLP